MLVSTLAAALVAGTGFVLSRRIERVAEKPPGNRVDDAFRETARRIDALDGMWQSALEAEARRLLETNTREVESTVVGVVQCSWLNPGFSDPSRAHRLMDGSEPRIRPILDRFAKGEPGEWIFSANEVINGSGWIETPGHPLSWRQGNGRTSVILQLDPQEAVGIVRSDLARQVNVNLPNDEPGTLTWTDPGGDVFLSTGKPAPGATPDEILRHVSRFGDWTLRRHYPVKVVTSYRPPVLAGSFTLAALLLAGGAAVISWQRKATRLAEQRVSFVNRVSHELRTPLTNLLLNTDLALDSLTGDHEGIRRRLGLIREETARLSRIVDNVQTFARGERGKHEIHTAPCDVEKLANGLWENFAPLFARKSIHCGFDFQLSRKVTVDQDALSQILSNLLSNVEKYAGESAKARVAISEEAGHLVVEVEDDGPGIPADARTRIFLPFERAGSRVNEGATGTGLGLSISRDLARQMGGRLELLCTSQGAKFRLVLPLGERSGA
ncbi:hypothetical protein GCM10023212_38430 [Luteolibacter yonseiensis]